MFFEATQFMVICYDSLTTTKTDEAEKRKQITTTRNEKGISLRGPLMLKIRACYGQLYANKFNNSDEMNKCLLKHNF